MTHDKTQQDIDQITGFMEAYPFPEYPKKSTSAQQEAIDQDYYRLMRQNGIEPNHVTSMEFNKIMVKRLMQTAFPEQKAVRLARSTKI